MIRVLLLSCFVAFAALPAAACQATAASYNALQVGMTYAQAIKIIGCAGEEMARNQIGEFESVAVRWWGRGQPGANLIVFFQNGRVMQKAQGGLQ